jgi:hypothetical protein
LVIVATSTAGVIPILAPSFRRAEAPASGSEFSDAVVEVISREDRFLSALVAFPKKALLVFDEHFQGRSFPIR